MDFENNPLPPPPPPLSRSGWTLFSDFWGGPEEDKLSPNIILR